jgi:3-phenylpropionate/trans-cinnamate dioxygenase ferredoxin subunit
MTDWIDVAPEGAMAEGEHLVVDLDDGTAVAVFRVQGQYYAVEDACTHDGNPIAGGRIIGTEIVCPRHAARFCLKTGAALCPPAYEDIASFETRVQDGRIQVRNRD